MRKPTAYRSRNPNREGHSRFVSINLHNARYYTRKTEIATRAAIALTYASIYASTYEMWQIHKFVVVGGGIAGTRGSTHRRCICIFKSAVIPALHVRALTQCTNIEFTLGKIRVQIPGVSASRVLTRLSTCKTLLLSVATPVGFSCRASPRDSDELIRATVSRAKNLPSARAASRALISRAFRERDEKWKFANSESLTASYLPLDLCTNCTC